MPRDRRQRRQRVSAIPVTPRPSTAIRRPPSEGQDIVADYASLGLTLKRHPLELLRKRLAARGILRACDLPRIRSGTRVRVAGIVSHRQRPETASGVVFISLEDESGIVNIIVWTDVQASQRQAVFGSHLMAVEGELQNEMSVIHVVAQKVRDYSPWLGELQTESRDFH